MIVCFSYMTARLGKEEILKKALLDLIEPTRKEKGCIAYELLQDLENPLQFVVVEKFMSQEDLDEHVERPYIKSFMTEVFYQCVESSYDQSFKTVL